MNTTKMSPSTTTQAVKINSIPALERTLRVQGMEIEVFESAGSGDPIFLFHGNSSSAESFLPLFGTELGKRHKLIAASLPGHGRSGRPLTDHDKESTYSLAGLGQFAAGVVNAFAASRYWLVGQSVSGHALLESLETFPGASGLVLLSAPPVSLQQFEHAFRPSPASAMIFKSQLSEDELYLLSSAFSMSTDSELLHRIRQYIRSADPQFRALLGASLARGQVKDECHIFNTTRLPIALMGGMEDHFLNTAYYASLDQSRLWGGAACLLQNAGHVVHLDAPRQVAAFIEDFVEREGQ